MRTLATSGPPSRQPFAFYDPDSCCWRTSAGSLDFGPELDVQPTTWPVSGTTRGGACWAPTTWAPPTAGTVGGASPGLLPTPQATDSEGPRSDELLLAGLAEAHATGDLLPTPAAGNFNDGESVESWQARRDRLLAEGVNGNGMGTPLPIAVQLLPSPTARDYHGAGDRGTGGPNLRTTVVQLDHWGRYAHAVARWETLTCRPAPDPTQPGTKGQPRLSPAFVEWLMGLPAGWVTDVPGVSRTAALTMLGNGQVPQQAAAALRALLGTSASRSRWSA